MEALYPESVRLISSDFFGLKELKGINDANGNLLRDGSGFQREYNGLNQLVRVRNISSNIVIQEYVHDPFEERTVIKKIYFNNGSLKETHFYFDREYVRITNNTGTYDTEYVFIDSQQVAEVKHDGAKQYIHTDHLGSSSVVTDSNGIVIENTTYSPHGEVLTGGEATRFGYEGKEHDSVVGDTDFHFRKYCSRFGIFCQPDTIIQNVYDPQSLNRYMFERGNPYNQIDPDGHLLPLLFWGTFLIAAAVATTIIAIDKYQKEDNSGLAETGVTQAATIVFESVAPKAAGPVGVILGSASIAEGLVITYEDFTKDKEGEENTASLKMKKITYIDENGNQILLTVPEETNRLSISTEGGGMTRAVPVYTRKDGNVVWGDSNNVNIPDDATSIVDDLDN